MTSVQARETDSARTKSRTSITTGFAVADWNAIAVQVYYVEISEVPAVDEIPKGWIKAGSHPQSYDITIDTSTKRSGKASARIESNSAVVKGGFSTLMSAIKADVYRGKRIRLSAWMKTEDAVSAQVWMRLDGERRSFGFDNIDNRPVKGTTSWTKYELVLDVPEATLKIAFGFFVTEKGKSMGRRSSIGSCRKGCPLDKPDDRKAGGGRVSSQHLQTRISRAAG